MSKTVLSPGFLRSHLLMPLILFFLASIMLEESNADLWLADLIYRWSGSSWSLRDAWLTSEFIHNGGRSLVAVMTLALLTATVSSLFVARLRSWRRGLIYLLVSALASGLLINVLKELTHIDCPWDLLRYGGVQEYVRNFAALPSNMSAGGCFPAGHASAGWAWFGLYFWAAEFAPQWRKNLLSFVLLLGLVFGVSQELRGAHFLSHDLWTIGICWFLSLLLYLVFFHRTALFGESRIQSEKESPVYLIDRP